MNSSKKKKSRKNVVIRCRKISSTSNRSQFSFHHTPAGGYRRQIQTLIKNNKSLAVTLEDTRRELTSKQKILDESLPYLNKMMLARFKILKMYEGFKSFIKSFDNVLPLLEVKLTSVNASSRDCKKWKNKMKTVKETLEETAESHSMAEDIEMIENTGAVETSLNQSSNVDVTSGAHLAALNELTEGINESEDCHDVNMNDDEVISMDVLDNAPHVSKISNEENSGVEIVNHSDNAETHTTTGTPNLEMTFDLTQVPPQKSCEGVMEMKTIEKECVSPLIINSGTPKINIPQEFKATIEKSSDLETNASIKNTLRSKENISQISASSVLPSFQKTQTSKIPKPKLKNSSGTLIGNAKTSKRKCIKTGTKQSNASKRKTFVIKNDTKFSEFELPVVSDNTLPEEEKFADKNMANSEDLDRPSCSRKTFVIKPSDISENASSSSCDRRKTFVKKTCDPVKTDTTVKRKRKTFMVTEPTSTLNDQSVSCNAVEPVNIEKDDNLPINDISFEKEDSSTPVQPTNLVSDSGQILCNTENCSDVNSPKRTLSTLFDDTSSFFLPENKEKEDKAGKEGNEATGDVLLSEGINLPNNIENPLKGINEDQVKNHNVCSNASKPVSFRSDSFDEWFPSEPVQNISVFSFDEISPEKTPPIRRRMPIAKNKTVFVFDANKAVTSNTCTAEKSANACKQSTASCRPNIDSVNNLKMKNRDAESPKGTKKKKRTNVVDSKETNKAAILDGNLDLVSEKDLEKPHKKLIKNKSRQNYKSGDAETDCIVSIENVPKSDESKNLSDISGTAKNENNISFPNGNESNSKRQTPDDKSDHENKADKCCKNRKSKQDSTVDEIVPDVESIPKKCKKRSSKKSVAKNALKTKAKKSRNKADPEKMITAHNDEGKSTFVVHAEVHPVPSFVDMPGTSSTSTNKENEMQGIPNRRVSVVLCDIFGGLGNACEKEQLLQDAHSFPLKTVTSDNVLPVDNSHEAKATTSRTQDSLEIASSRRSRKSVNYKEPSLTKKMRQ